MSTTELVGKELAELPEALQHEVYNFVQFIEAKSQNEKFDGLLLSESVLAKDWSMPEEDAAWASL